MISGRSLSVLTLETLGSSSKGNCYLIRTSKEVLILECGLQYQKILQALNFDLSNVVGCLVTHEHLDHSKSTKDLAKKGIDIYSSPGTFEALGVTGHRVHPVEATKQFNLGGFTVLPFDTKHDAAEPIGFLIYHPEFGKLLFATDTYYIKYKFPSLNYVMLECNYSKEILERNVEAGRVNTFLKKRLLSSHFSLENVKKFFLANDITKLREIFLLHLSDGNSNARNFKSEIEKLTGVPVTVC